MLEKKAALFFTCGLGVFLLTAGSLLYLMCLWGLLFSSFAFVSGGDRHTSCAVDKNMGGKNWKRPTKAD